MINHSLVMQESQETWIWFLGQEDPLEEKMATHSRILAWKIPMEPGRLQSSSVQSLSPVQLFETPWTAARQVSLSFTISQSLLKLRSIESVIPPSHLVLCRLLLLLPSTFLCLQPFPENKYAGSGSLFSMFN